MQNFMKTILSAIQAWTKGKIKDSTADWNQNDSSADNYVKNRPFYETDDGDVHELDGKYIATSLDSKMDKENPVGTGSFSMNRKDGTTVGDYSHAEGQDTTASRYASHAEGGGTTASGYASHAEGGGTTASGYGSHAEGGDTTASESYSHAEGYSTTASGSYSHAEGYSTTASGSYSHAEGYKTTASIGSHAEGHITTASGAYSHAEGCKAQATTDTSATTTTTSTTTAGYAAHAEGYGTVANARCAHAEGNGTKASGYDSHAEGYSTKASGQSSHAEGYNTTASGYGSHAEGQTNTASGSSAHAEGFNNIASGAYSHAEGRSTKATTDTSATTTTTSTTTAGYAAHAEGYGTVACGAMSHAEGNGTMASGQNSHAEGCGTTARNKSQHVQGDYNILDNTTAVGTIRGTYAHIVGNGTSTSARSNAHTLDWEGNAWYQGDVYVGSTSGTNKDEGSVKLATEDYVAEAIAAANVDYDWHEVNAPLAGTVKIANYAINNSNYSWDVEEVNSVDSVTLSGEYSALGYMHGCIYLLCNGTIIDGNSDSWFAKIFAEFKAICDADVLSANVIYVCQRNALNNEVELAYQIAYNSSSNVCNLTILMNTASSGRKFDVNPYNLDTGEYTLIMSAYGYTDTTLSKANYSADAKSVGDALDNKLSKAGGELDVGATITVPNSSDANTKNAKLSSTSLSFNTVSNEGDGWTSGVLYYNNDRSSVLGRMSAYGTANEIQYYYVGTDYTAPEVKVVPDNGLVLTSNNYGDTLPSTGVAGRIFFKKV